MICACGIRSKHSAKPRPFPQGRLKPFNPNNIHDQIWPLNFLEEEVTAGLLKNTDYFKPPGLLLKPPIIIECYPFYLLVKCSSKIWNSVFGFNFRRSVGVEFHLITFALMNNKSKRIYLLQFNTRVEFYSTFLRCQL